ncbi:TetR/AcrR family transcriptional regulator [Actinomadura sp. KC216]|uniref:TetR/AcrR family transcriptional regulator n=1 Tax=Actinomadura sp. KC216 TaxID=2530370 RepID=UPI00105294D6|nr:TetR/AcrR family transcriptional regulator [Actinomadura sp. KC216]TDB83145.1 TetR/AcrR family transcriptional regulator [Actinomadura sp. KC216]
MARPRKFEEERAVEAAMRAFWADGYEATSTQELCNATGLGRSSIYNTFKSKHDLFEKALARYMDIKTSNIIQVLEDGGRPVRERLRTILEWAVEPEPGDPAGCLVVNTMVEMAPRDEAIAERIARDERRRLTALTAAVKEGMRTGEIDRSKDARALAHFIVSTVSGMRVVARGGAGRSTLTSIADTAMDAI